MDFIRRKAIERKLQLIKLSKAMAMPMPPSEQASETAGNAARAAAIMFNDPKRKQRVTGSDTVRGAKRQHTTLTSNKRRPTSVVGAGTVKTRPPMPIFQIKTPQPNVVSQIADSVNPIGIGNFNFKQRPGGTSSGGNIGL